MKNKKKVKNKIIKKIINEILHSNERKKLLYSVT